MASRWRVTTFMPADDPVASGREDGRFIVLLLDDLSTPLTRGWKVKEIAERFANLMGPKDVVTVIRLNGDKATTSSSRSVVLSAIKRFAPFGGGSTPSIRTPTRRWPITSLTEQMAESPHRRKVLRVDWTADLLRQFPVRRGHSWSHTRDGAGVKLEWFEAVRESGRNNVSVYVINALSPGGRRRLGRRQRPQRWRGRLRRRHGRPIVRSLRERRTRREEGRLAGRRFVLPARLRRTGRRSQASQDRRAREASRRDGARPPAARLRAWSQSTTCRPRTSFVAGRSSCSTGRADSATAG